MRDESTAEAAEQRLIAQAERQAEASHACVRTLVLGIRGALHSAAANEGHHDVVVSALLAGCGLLTLVTWLALLHGWRSLAVTLVAQALDVVVVVGQLQTMALSSGMPQGHLFMLPSAGLVGLVVVQTVLRLRPTLVLDTGALALLVIGRAIAFGAGPGGRGAGRGRRRSNRRA
jgi:hypothetical protein